MLDEYVQTKNEIESKLQSQIVKNQKLNDTIEE